MLLSNTLSSINNINTKVNKLFHNPNINFFIIMNLILIISCYTFINSPLKHIISSFLSNPIIILFTLITIILIGYYNINIAILVLLLLFIGIYGSTIFNNNNNNNKYNQKYNQIEGFTDNDDNDDSDDEEDEFKTKQAEALKNIKDQKLKSREDTIKGIKDVVLGSVTKLTNDAENEYKKSLVENKKIIYENEKKNNKNNKIKNSSTKKKGKTGKEEFQTVDTRSFDPLKEEDTNLLITKEILQDMINRVDYKFETTKYLKKYLKHRIEEIVELNKLLEDEED
jgi:Ca2+/Na+ antiporter